MNEYHDYNHAGNCPCPKCTPEPNDLLTEGKLIDYLRYLNGEGLLGEDASKFRASHYTNPYQLGRELYQMLDNQILAKAQPVIDDLKETLEYMHEAYEVMQDFYNNEIDEARQEGKKEVMDFVRNSGMEKLCVMHPEFEQWQAFTKRMGGR